MKRPAFQFYPADWRNDAALRMCSLAARGLWWEMICVMHTAEPYGHLVAAGQPITRDELARIVGESKADVTKWLSELERRQVYSVTEGGAIYSRRMVRDQEARDKWGKRQRKHRDKSVTGNDKEADVTRDVTPMSQLSSSSSSEVPPLAPPPDGKGKRRQRKPVTEAPDSFEVTDELAEWAVAQGLREDQIELQTTKMLNHFKAKGEMRSDWVATWRNWILKAVEYGQGKAA